MVSFFHLQIKGRLLRGKDGIEISSVEMAIRKKLRGHDIIATLNSKGKSLNVHTEVTNYPDDVRIIYLIVSQVQMYVFTTECYKHLYLFLFIEDKGWKRRPRTLDYQR